MSRPRQLAILILVVLAVVVFWFTRDDRQEGTVGATRPSVTASESDSSTSTPRPSVSLTADPEVVAPAAGEVENLPDTTADTARAVVTAWQIQDVAARDAALTPLVTPAYREGISYADPTLIPTGAIEEAETEVDADGSALVRVVLDGGVRLAVVLEDPEGDGTWVASAINDAGQVQQ